MVLQLIEAVNKKIERGELLEISVEMNNSYMLNMIIPDTINYKEKGLYIEGDNLILKISDINEENIFYDSTEDEFVIKSQTATYFLS